mmetsp:Transcript_99052/g.288940  ORF Transcript_99052/g.288940 Transcript_99052/m.288940 type:complete len:438 (+) Transcript_99052:1305-2618(+)
MHKLDVDELQSPKGIQGVDNLNICELSGIPGKLLCNLLQELLIAVLHPHQAVVDEAHLRHGEGLVLAPRHLVHDLHREGVLGLQAHAADARARGVRLQLLLQLVELAGGEGHGRQGPVVEDLHPVLRGPHDLLHHEVGLLEAPRAPREAQGRHHHQARGEVFQAVDEAAGHRGEDVRVPVLELRVREGEADHGERLAAVKACPKQVLVHNLHKPIIADTQAHHAIDHHGDRALVKLLLDTRPQLPDQGLHEDRPRPLAHVAEREDQQPDARGRVHLQPAGGVGDDLVDELAVEDVEARAGPEEVGGGPRGQLVHVAEDLALEVVEERDEGRVELDLALQHLVVAGGLGAHVHGADHVDHVELGQVLLHQLEHRLVLGLRKQPRLDHLIRPTPLGHLDAVVRHGRRGERAARHQVEARLLGAQSHRLPASAAPPAQHR